MEKNNMSEKYNLIQNDLKTAIKCKDTNSVNALRAVIAELQNIKVINNKDIDDSIVLTTIKKYIKRYNDSITQFTKANRFDLVEKEKAELICLEKYIPAMLSEDEVKQKINLIIEDNTIECIKRNFGTIMKFLKTLPEKDLIDMQLASKYLNSILK
jgi:uncharacterized protein YqeY